METTERNLRKTKVGVVVSDKMDKMRIVAVVSNEKHPLYKKVVKKTKKFFVKDETNECKAGDTIEIIETRPLSKNCRFRLLRIIEKAK